MEGRIMIFKCLVGLSDGNIITCDGIEFEDMLWIVPGWLYHDAKGHAIPERMIRFDNLAYHESNSDEFKYDNITLPVGINDLITGALPDDIEHIDNALHVKIPANEFQGQ
jgi:hypothetical protein